MRRLAAVAMPAFLASAVFLTLASAGRAETIGKSPADLMLEAVKKYQENDPDGALRILNQLAAAHPNFSPAVYGQAAIHFILGRFQQASDTLQKYLSAVQGDDFAWMWAYVAQARAGNPDRGTLSEVQALADPASWLYKTLDLFLGATSPDDYLKAAKETPKLQRDNTVCRAHFFIAEFHLLSKNAVKAKEAFQACVDQKGDFLWEREMSRAELKKLQEKPQAKEEPDSKG